MPDALVAKLATVSCVDRDSAEYFVASCQFDVSESPAHYNAPVIYCSPCDWARLATFSDDAIGIARLKRLMEMLIAVRMVGIVDGRHRAFQVND